MKKEKKIQERFISCRIIRIIRKELTGGQKRLDAFRRCGNAASTSIESNQAPNEAFEGAGGHVTV